MASTLNLFRKGAVGFIDWLDPDDAFLPAMHADELPMTRNVERHCNPRSYAGNQNVAHGMQRAEALNQKAAMTCRTAVSKRQRNGNALTDEKNRERDSDQPGPTEHQRRNDANEQDGQPQAGPDDEPRLSIEAAGDRLLNRVH